MEISFSKYQGAGNDFIMINGFENKDYEFLNQDAIELLCDRRFGIGGDGLIMIKPTLRNDFEMLYYNADGLVGSMCGNGGRCSFRFAYDIKKIGEQAIFLASDGTHTAFLNNDGMISLQMKDVAIIKDIEANTYELNTGSPHIVQIVEDLTQIDLVTEGRKIRNSAPYKEEGINVNFMEVFPDHIRVATYERGVENETYSCGTGVTAAALVAMRMGLFSDKVEVLTKGGILFVTAKMTPAIISDIWLTGPAQFVYKGSITL